MTTVAELISPQKRALMVTRIAAEHGAERAEQALDAAIEFLLDAAQSPQPLSPSPLADIGWHEFILHTRAYAEFCERVAGRFIHHEPLPVGTCEAHECRTSVSECKGQKCYSCSTAASGGSCGATEETQHG